MTGMTDLNAAIVLSARHCTQHDCAKCRARSRWLRRKSWRSRKSRLLPPATGRGDAK